MGTTKDVREAVEKELSFDPMVDSTKITVRNINGDVTAETTDGIITLTGHVPSWAEHDAVVNAASMAVGVIDIRDNLTITG